MTKYRYFSCHRYDINTSKKPTSKVPIQHQYRHIDIGDISATFSIYRPTSNDNSYAIAILSNVLQSYK